MIRIIDLSKSYPIGKGRKVVANKINVTFPTGECVALLGRNGAGKSSLLRMIAGTVKPDRGLITSNGTISWPIGFAGSFHKDLTGLQNAKFVARVYGVETTKLLEFVEDFAELGAHFNLPVRTYSSGMKSRLAFGISMAIQFDTYLIDEVTAVGDAAFKKKCNNVLEERLKDSGAIVVSHSMKTIKKLCTMGAILENGQLSLYSSIDDAIQLHEKELG